MKREENIFTHNIWITDINGQELMPIRTLAQHGLQDHIQYRFHDIEWLPDESGVSFVWGRQVVNMLV